MLDWFKHLDPKVQAAIIAGCATIIGAIIAGIFSVVKKSKGTQSSTTINQKQGIGNRGMQIGIQNTTVNVGDTSVEDGTMMIGCGNASESSSIRCMNMPNNDKSRGNKK